MLRFALVGRGVSGSLSPRMYNWFFRARGYRASYEVVDVDDGLDSIIGMLRELDGFNVTIPFKVSIISFLDGVEGAAKHIGAVNTVKAHNGRLIGYNTDHAGFLYALRLSGNTRYDTALIIGAGGASRAALYALRGLVRRVYIVSRTGHTAVSLATTALSWGFEYSHGAKRGDSIVNEAVSKSDLIVNASPVGSDGVSVPIDVGRLEEPCTVIDMVYRPLNTPLLEAAMRAGCTTIDGLWMLAAQASENLKLWLNADVPPPELRRAALGDT
ncbi:MAG: shikimate dehydrogenase [Desulfurococcales archaeon]|nr:shikimate dehydrogenase [Desulfurococcales archaeon]